MRLSHEALRERNPSGPMLSLEMLYGGSFKGKEGYEEERDVLGRKRV